MKPPEIDAVSQLITEAAEEEILPRFRNLAEADIREKSPGEPVTAADEAMERRLADALLCLLPGSELVGEEGAATDESLLERLAGESPVWVVDPLDGTANFAAGKPVFGVMVCLVHRAQTVAAWIHHPVGGAMLVAERGSGARLDGRPVRIGTARERMRASIHTKFFPASLRAQADAVRSMFEAHETWHCAARTYLDLVTGDLDIAMYYRLMPWDHAPGVLIHAEAGGFSTRLNGEPYSPLVHTGGLLLAPTQDVWRNLEPIFTGA